MTNTPSFPARAPRRTLPDLTKSRYSTGNTLVDQIGCLKLQGLRIDRRWSHDPLFQKAGRLNVTALLVYADIVDWYRPIEERTEDGGKSWRKKFSAPWLLRTKTEWARALGLSVRQLELALDFLSQRGLIKYNALSPKRRALWAEQGLLKVSNLNQKPLVVKPFPNMLRRLSGMEEASPSAVSEEISSGNPIVNEFAQMHFGGDFVIVDYNWLGHSRFCNDRGHFNIIACIVFADLFFLHTPYLEFDRATRQVIGHKAKFKGERMYIDYTMWERTGWFSVRQYQDAIAFLHKATLINRTVGGVQLPSGHNTNNVPLVKLVMETLLEVTYQEKKPHKQQGVPQNVGDFSREASPLEAGCPAKSEAHFTGDTSRKSEVLPILDPKSSPFGGTPSYIHSSPFLVTEEQQQQREAQSVEVERTAPVVGSTSSSSTSKRLDPRSQALTDALFALGSGCAKKFIAAAVRANYDHCALWLKWWPSQKEATPAFWLERGGEIKTAGALRLRLEDESNIPPQVLALRNREASNAARKAAEQTSAQERERAAFEREMAAASEELAAKERAENALDRFENMCGLARKNAVDRVGSGFDFLRDRLKIGSEALVQRALDGGLEAWQERRVALILADVLDQIDEERAAEAAVGSDSNGVFLGQSPEFYGYERSEEPEAEVAQEPEPETQGEEEEEQWEEDDDDLQRADRANDAVFHALDEAEQARILEQAEREVKLNFTAAELAACPDEADRARRMIVWTEHKTEVCAHLATFDEE